MNRVEGYSLFECIVSLVVIAIFVPVIFKMFLVSIHSCDLDIYRSIAYNELINYRSLSAFADSESLWYLELKDYPWIKVSSKSGNNACIALSSSVKSTWCIG